MNLELRLWIHERQERVQSAVGIPERKHGVPRVTACLAGFVASEDRIHPVDVAQDAGMDQRMVKGCVEADSIIVAPAGDFDAL